MRHLTGQETVEFGGYQRPEAMMVYELRYDYPRHSLARGLLLSVSVDAFERACASDEHRTMAPILKKYLLGGVRIEFGRSITGVKVSTEQIDLCPNPKCEKWLVAGGNFCTHCGTPLRCDSSPRDEPRRGGPMTKEEFQASFHRFESDYPGRLMIMRGSADVERHVNVNTVCDSESRTFANYDPEMLEFIRSRLLSGKHVAVSAAGKDHVMILAGRDLLRRR